MVEMILRKTGVALLTILTGVLHAALLILKLLCGGAKLFLLLFAVITRAVISLIGMAGRN
ncbi:MAG: hypothetical protein J6B94_04385 [Lachnospiraceae bacterium]|nr:hypothetical protein [Lachnospiraceae bacterium]